VATFHPTQRSIGLKSELPSASFDGEIHGPHLLYTLFVHTTDRLFTGKKG
jgi:hypothetical protein